VTDINPIGVAVPVFIGLICLEWLVSRWKKRGFYRMNDAVSDLACGMGDQMIGLVVAGITFGVYTLVSAQWGIWELSTASMWTWVFGIVSVDLCYYGYHRFAHRVNVGWATHVVHHQSEEYNLAVALRQPWFAQFSAWLVYLPLAVLGLPPEVYGLSYAINLLYQFWIHTRFIGKLGPIEWVMNTPSHHRVHHGTNPQYIDKNYGGIFIVWDRIFGTFVEEQEEPLFGIMKPLASWNPITANVKPLADLMSASLSMPRFTDKFRVWVAEPGWTPGGVVDIPFPAPNRGYDKDESPSLHVYAMAHLLPVSIATGCVIAFVNVWPTSWLAVGTAYIFWTCMGWVGIFEGTAWARGVELSRLIVVGAGSAVVASATTGGQAQLGFALLALFSVFSIPWFWRGYLSLGRQ
jgi:alkylglycerol monooxygenase